MINKEKVAYLVNKPFVFGVGMQGYHLLKFPLKQKGKMSRESIVTFLVSLSSPGHPARLPGSDMSKQNSIEVEYAWVLNFYIYVSVLFIFIVFCCCFFFHTYKPKF